MPGWLSRLIGRERRSSTSFDDPRLALIFGSSPTSSGVTVGPNTALRSPTTLACVRAISEAVGQLPVCSYRRGIDGSLAREDDSPLAHLLAGAWAPWSSSSETRAAVQLDSLLHGGGYVQAVRVGGVVTELHRLDPTQVTVAVDEYSGEPRYSVQTSSGQRTLGWGDVVNVHPPGSALFRPIRLVDLAADAIGIDVAMAAHQGYIFRNGARPGGILTTEKTLTEEAAARLAARWRDLHAGASHTGSTAVLEDGLKWEAMQFSSVDLQFLELRRYAMTEIARAFKVPLTLIGDLERATWRNVEELARQFLQFSLMPWLEVWQAALTRVLIAPEDRAKIFIRFDVDDLVRGDIATRYAAFRNATGTSWITPNEARRFDNLPPVDGGDRLVLQAGQSGASAAPEEGANA